MVKKDGVRLRTPSQYRPTPCITRRLYLHNDRYCQASTDGPIRYTGCQYLYYSPLQLACQEKFLARSENAFARCHHRAIVRAALAHEFRCTITAGERGAGCSKLDHRRQFDRLDRIGVKLTLKLRDSSRLRCVHATLRGSAIFPSAHLAIQNQ